MPKNNFRPPATRQTAAQTIKAKAIKSRSKRRSVMSQSEVHAYAYILKELTEKKGWTKNQIYTQGECLNNPEIRKHLGLTKPENVIEINPKTFYVIESKNERSKIEQALKEAKEDYADKINESNRIQALFVTGLAGNEEEGYIAKSQFYKNGKWETITENEIEITGLISTKQAEDILSNQTAHIKDVEITENEFLETAENINDILHENSINKDYRAKFISAILLAMSDGKEIDVTQSCDVLIENLNSRVKAILRKHDKLNFANFIKIDEPSSSDNHIKVKEAIKRNYQELLNLNIRSAMNSGKDVLGKFYEVFLKYGNGAKDIGIVLTPRHITKFASEVLDINYKDLILDPACGTGGFLVSAFDEVRKKTKNKDDFENFRLNGLYGIEEQDSIISLALVNMIFRGDGKNNMIEGNCFRKWLNAKTEGKKYHAEYLTEDNKDRIPPITKVMMNPPFALKKADEKEYKFVEHALKQMEDGGLLFVILPISVMIKSAYKSWRKDLLNNNILLSVISFPDDLFYPVAVHTVGVFIKKGIPHDFSEQNVYFAKADEDGFIKKKGIKVFSKEKRNKINEIQEELKSFILNQKLIFKNIPEFKIVCKLDTDDDDLELVPEAYIETDYSKTNEDEFKESVRKYMGYLVKEGDSEVIKKLKSITDNNKKTLDLSDRKWKYFNYADIFSIERGFYNKRPEEVGNLNFVSASRENNAVTDKLDKQVVSKVFKSNCITVVNNGYAGEAFYQREEFTCSHDVNILRIKDYTLTENIAMFLITIIKKEKSKFNYGRKWRVKRMKKSTIKLPVNDAGKPDWEFMERYIVGLKYFG